MCEMWVAVVSSLPMGTTAWPCLPGVRLSETPVAFAGAGRVLTETAIAFAGAGRAVTETVIAFAGENWVFLARFSVALALPVSMVAVQGRALVMVVSRWPVSVVVEVSLVASSPRGCVLCAKKFALRGLMVGASAKKFAQRTKNSPKLAVYGVLGELFRGWGVGGGVLGELFRGRVAEGAVLGELFRACRPTTACRPYGQALRHLQHTPYR